MDLSVFTTPEAWISLVTLMFLEVVLGVDNLVFISITSSRLPAEKQHIGRRLGLAGALVMRCLLLCLASWLVHITEPLFTVEIGSYVHGISLRDIILLVGGIYLIYKGIDELRDSFKLADVDDDMSDEDSPRNVIGLPRAIITIMLMDVVLSIDSVITAVGLAQYLIVMIIAVIAAVLIMMIFIDFISDFLNRHVEIKILALFFIAVVGVLLVLDSLGIQSGIVVLGMQIERLMVYFAMVFSLVITLIQMRYTQKRRVHEVEQAVLRTRGRPEDTCEGSSCDREAELGGNSNVRTPVGSDEAVGRSTGRAGNADKSDVEA